MKLEFASNVTPLTSTPTVAGQVYVMIIPITDSNVTYTEVFENGTTATYTAEALSAGQTLYGTFHTVSATSGHAKVAR